MSFNNTKGTVSVDFKGESIELIEQKYASGFWYKNDQYELRGKGNDFELTQEGKVIFTYKDNIVKTSFKDKEGQILDIAFNKTTNCAKVYLNGGEEIELAGKKSESGHCYNNDHYKLIVKGETVEFSKDGKTIFKN